MEPIKIINEVTRVKIGNLTLPKNSLWVSDIGDSKGTVQIMYGDIRLFSLPYTDYRNSADESFASKEDLITYLSESGFNTGGGDGIGVTLAINSASDLTIYLSGDEYVLPSGLIVVNGTIDLGGNSIRISNGTVLRGLANANFLSTNANGVIRATNTGSHLILREFNVICSTGPCFVLEGSITYQLNMFFIGAIGLNAGTITGFQVQSIKQCYVDANDGFTFDGTTNKVFVSESPFYGITGSAITFASTLVANVADIVTSFFKFDSPGTGITAEVGYSIGEGRLRGTLIDGTAIPLDGLAKSDLNWIMTDNSGIANSQILGGLYLTTSVETAITTINTPVKVLGTTTGLTLNERFTATNNRLTYTGLIPAVVMFIANASVGSGNNTNLTFYLAKNGSVVTETGSDIRIGAGGDERNVSISGIISMEETDYVELWGENTDDTTNFECLSLTLNGVGQ